MSQRLEPLWAALSATITQIEANLPAHTDTSSEVPSAAASILPPGAAQVCHHPSCTPTRFFASAQVMIQALGCRCELQEGTLLTPAWLWLCVPWQVLQSCL